jgi:quercetin dioxygenase-like cupin family protein
MEHPASCATGIAPASPAASATQAPIIRRGLLGSAIAASAAGLLAPFDGSTARATVLATEPGPPDEIIRLGPLAVRFLVTGQGSGGSIAAFEVLVPAAQRLAAPAHSHDAYEETIFGISGVLTWTVDGRPIEVGPGQALCIPRGAVHRFDNNGSADVKALCVVTPAAIGPDYFREAAEVINEAAGGPPDVARMMAVMRRHGISPARP